MNWAAKYQAKCEQYWPEIKQFFSRLPPRLSRQAVLLQNNLTTFYADTGQFKDILSRERDHPLLYLHFWLLDDWSYPTTTAPSKLKKHLFMAMLFAFTAVNTQATILDESTNVDNTYLFLENILFQQANFHLAQIFPGSSPFWTYHQTFWQEYAEAVLSAAANSTPLAASCELGVAEGMFIQIAREIAVSGATCNLQPATIYRGVSYPLPAGKLAFTKIPAAAVAIYTGREKLLFDLRVLLDRFNGVFQIMREIVTLRRDLAQRNYTYPILRTLQVAGLDPLQPLPPEQILGAMVLTGSISGICRENSAELQACRSAAQSLDLPSFAAYLTGVEAWVTEVQDLFLIKRASTPSKPQPPLFAPHVDTLSKVIEMAEGYLLSDPTFRESWEVQRRGLFGLAEMIGKAFPMGLIVEILCRYGHQMERPIDDIFTTLQATGFRYYNHPHLPPDTDDLGLLLRLCPYSTQPDRCRSILQTPLRWLENSLGASGEIPVWLDLPPNDPGEVESPFLSHTGLSLWGQSCATVEANVLLGLIVYDEDGYRSLILRSAENWCERTLIFGLSATFHYVPLYALWVALELIARLRNLRQAPSRRGTVGDGVQPNPGKDLLLPKLDLTAQKLAECLIIETNRSYLTPQDAAFLTLACLSPGLPVAVGSLFKPEWITLLCKSQRYDGSWAGEPLFGTPTRGELASWYSSRMVTSAFCYHALKTYQTKICLNLNAPQLPV